MSNTKVIETGVKFSVKADMGDEKSYCIDIDDMDIDITDGNSGVVSIDIDHWPTVKARIDALYNQREGEGNE